MAICKICNIESTTIAKELGLCLKCIRDNPDKSLPIAMETHYRSRQRFGLQTEPPKSESGVPCKICANQCSIGDGEKGYCGLRKNREGKLVGLSVEKAYFSWHHDPLPTNCVGDWVCPGGTGVGYPEFSYCQGAERGFKNMAVFFEGCSFNCLFCQNWHFKEESLSSKPGTLGDLLRDVDKTTSCVSFIGGDPSVEIAFSVKASKSLDDANSERILRFCWETNGSMNETAFDEIAKIAMKSGGSIKFDLKCYDETLHKVLTGVTNEQTFSNFKRAGKFFRERSNPPLIIASTLLVPGYIDHHEVRAIARFIASIDKNIPYTLIAFYPHFYMKDLPFTSRELAKESLEAAKDEGLRYVRIGNKNLLV